MLCLVMVLGVFAGCGDKKTTQQAEAHLQMHRRLLYRR